MVLQALLSLRENESCEVSSSMVGRFCQAAGSWSFLSDPQLWNARVCCGIEIVTNESWTYLIYDFVDTFLNTFIILCVSIPRYDKTWWSSLTKLLWTFDKHSIHHAPKKYRPCHGEDCFPLKKVASQDRMGCSHPFRLGNTSETGWYITGGQASQCCQVALNSAVLNVDNVFQYASIFKDVPCLMYIPGCWFGAWILFFHIWGMSSSQLTFIFFRGVGIPPTRYCMPNMEIHGAHIQQDDHSHQSCCRWNPAGPAAI